jgi:ABC-type dipeptide/oligopeptide/nickel transport system permease subunit
MKVQMVRKIFSKNKNLLFGVVLFLLLIFTALLPHVLQIVFRLNLDPYAMTPHLKLSPFSTQESHFFLLGTDDLGRDLFARLLFGSKITLAVGLGVVGISTTAGILIGLSASGLGGWFDQSVMSIINILMSFPNIVLAMIIVCLLGPSLFHATIAVSIAMIPRFALVVRSCVLAENNKVYVIAAQTYGASRLRILFKEILPNCMGPIVVQATLSFSEGILDTTALSFLGLGATPPLPEWGVILSDARAYIESDPWQVILPGFFILLSVLSFNLIGEGLRPLIDPRIKS